MKLIIGGTYQGKREYAKQMYGLKDFELIDGADETAVFPFVSADKKVTGVKCIYNLHLLIRHCMETGKEPEEIIFLLADKYPDILFISDEIGYGLVPSDAFERKYREKTGRICCRLAKEAAEVTRVVCGIGKRIKE